MNALEKVIGHLVMTPNDIDFNVNTVKEKRYDGEEIEEIFITINVDDSKTITSSENYDEHYAITLFNYIEDKIHSALRYLGKQDELWQVRYNHYNQTFINQLEKDIEEIVKDFTLRKSQEDQTKYEFDVTIEASKRAPHLYVNIGTNLPEDEKRDLYYTLVDEHGYDNMVIDFDFTS